MCNVDDGVVRTVLVALLPIQGVTLVEPRAPLPIDLLDNVCVHMHAICSTLRDLWEGLPCRLVVFLEEEIHLHALLSLWFWLDRALVPF